MPKYYFYIFKNMSDAAFEKTLTLGDAIRLSGPMAFNIMIKPAGSLCNLDCKYCYYLDKAEIYGGKEPRMTEAMLEKWFRNISARTECRR